MLSDLNGARAVVSRLRVGKVTFVPEPEEQAYLIRATLAPARVISSASPTGFYTYAHPATASSPE